MATEGSCLSSKDSPAHPPSSTSAALHQRTDTVGDELPAYG